ncbi:MAG: 1-acyl-sn-glycerol-3-phosphate acyltransferase [Saprospiraceae bacterium]|nr:1-acyl-sn-glycerol-3-phosphate acyltransferase [Saprospiraceae bacterium]MDW8485259.1 1-acyl-sn-glycerol-3-phosphate acyltransferase [Saprospiraceae bacterium]
MKKELRLYPPLYENIEDWPIYRLSQDRANFIRQVEEVAFERLASRSFQALVDLLVKTIYQERIRIKESPWKVDPPDEKVFWSKVSKQLIQRSLDRPEAEARAEAEEILRRIIRRYAEEIVGSFRISTVRFARRFLTVFFNWLFNAAIGKNFAALWCERRQLYERLNVVGDIETVRSLFQYGTVVVVPTHSSNLDSILIGYVMDQIMGLPSFSYGAGLNLYNFTPAAYFMNRLGAYRVDRRKKNPIYLETLKTMSRLSIQRGVNSLFFPGGTRARSGELEHDLKRGLLSTTVEAQRALFAQGSDKKVFIVPIVLSYHFVLEAPFLIEEYLCSIGKEHYLRLRDEGYSIGSWFRFIWRFFSTTSDIAVSVGKPMDVLGNFVDAYGRSYDWSGNPIDIRDYFRNIEGEINEDRQRESEYTRRLAARIAARYKVDNIVLSSQLVAFAVFEILARQNPKLDLFGLLRLPPDDYRIPFQTVVEVVAQMQQQLLRWEQEGKIKLSEEIRWPPAELVRHGVSKLGVFHREKPLYFAKDNHIVSSNFRLLYFYHNRLKNYGLERAVQWKHQDFAIWNNE